MLRVVLAFSALLSAGLARAHPEIENAINRLNAEIAAAPRDAELYMQRGELYARHELWTMAEANYFCAAELNPDHPRLARARGALELATGRAAEARTFLDATLARDSNDPEALVLRARAHVALKSPAAAVADFDAALRLIATPPPELYLERAALLAPEVAIRSLDEGIERVGPAITLHLRAVALEESLGRIDAALDRLGRLTEQSERKEAWLKRRGDLLTRAGRREEARAAYASALKAVYSLPDWLQASPDVRRLIHELTPLARSHS